MSKYLVSVSYDGSLFYGWARQNNLFTVQGFIEDRISLVFSCKVSLLASSRTDKGVHAIDQKFTFFLDSININSFKMKKALSKSLEKFVQVNEVKIVDDNFDLRKNIKLKEYRYFSILKNYSIFQRNYFLDSSFRNIKLLILQKALKNFEGKHDFFNFSYIKKINRETTNTVREIKEISIYLVNESIFCIKFVSKGFLRYQIRAILGECIERYDKENGISILLEMLKADKVLKYNKIAPPSGLYLWKVLLKDENKVN